MPVMSIKATIELFGGTSKAKEIKTIDDNEAILIRRRLTH